MKLYIKSFRKTRLSDNYCQSMEKINAGNSSLNSTFDTNLNDIKCLKFKILITRDIYLQFFSAQNSLKYVKIISLFFISVFEIFHLKRRQIDSG